jgi:hypothetical protein
VHRAGRQVALVTRGDVNSGVERWSTAADARIGKLALRIPHAGYAVTWVTRLPIILALLAIVLLAFVRAVGAARGSRRVVRRVSGSALSALASAAMIISVPLMFSATEGAFSAVTANAANSFQAAATFCSSATLNATADTALTESSPGTNHGGLVELAVQSETGQNIRSLVKFAVPTVPAGCTMTSARLRLTLTPSAVVFGFYLGMGRTLQALHVTGAWTENGATWTNKPATTTINQALYATGFAVAPHDFTVTSQVAAMIAAPATNNGFLIRDSVESDSGSQPYHSRQAASGVPTLTITYAPS